MIALVVVSEVGCRWVCEDRMRCIEGVGFAGLDLIPSSWEGKTDTTLVLFVPIFSTTTFGKHSTVTEISTATTS